MRTKRRHPCVQAFTLKDLLVVLLVLGLLASFVLPWLARGRAKARSICCNCNLKQIGLAFRQWAWGSTKGYPMQISTNFGGTAEHVATGETFRHLQVLSNELNTPIILVCPADSRRPAAHFTAGFANTNVSYFIGVDANESLPQMFLSGDRNVTGGVRLVSGILELTTNQLTGWNADLHCGQGNISHADGSVQGFTSARLHAAVRQTGMPANRLALP